MKRPFATLLYELFIEPVQWFWNRSIARNVSKTHVQVRWTPPAAVGNVAWELEKASWRPLQTAVVPAESSAKPPSPINTREP